MTDNAVAFLYILMAALVGTMGIALGRDAWRDHYQHQPTRALVVWIAWLFSLQGIFFIGLAAARWYIVEYGVRAPWLFSPFWPLLLLGMAVCVIGFYSALRESR